MPNNLVLCNGVYRVIYENIRVPFECREIEHKLYICNFTANKTEQNTSEFFSTKKIGIAVRRLVVF